MKKGWSILAGLCLIFTMSLGATLDAETMKLWAVVAWAVAGLTGAGLCGYIGWKRGENLVR